MAREAGWRTDPYGRYQQRYWDGERWTEHVSAGGTALVDPLGASMVIPIVLPETATGARPSPWPPPDPRDRRG